MTVYMQLMNVIMLNEIKMKYDMQIMTNAKLTTNANATNMIKSAHLTV
jgi:hypothetical protein